MSGLLKAAREAAARGFSQGLSGFGRVLRPRRIRTWLIPPRSNAWSPITPGGRLALAPVPTSPPATVPYRRGTSVPPAPPILRTHWPSVPFDSTGLEATRSRVHGCPRRAFFLVMAVSVTLFGSTCAFAQCGGGPCCGSGPSCGGCPSICSPGPGCCCPSGGCGFGCSAGCGCARSPFGFGFFGGNRCCAPCGGCCGPVCGPSCSGMCGSICGPRCGPMCGPPCGGGPCGFAPSCGSCCGGPSCGLACGPCGPGACGAGSCGSCVPNCGGAPGPCGAGCCPTPTYETTPALPPGSMNRPGYPPADGPGDSSGPPITIPKRPVAPPDDKGTRFERRPLGSSSTATAVDVTQNSDRFPAAPQTRLFRQSVSAGFHTQVLTAQRGRLLAGGRPSRSIPSKPRPEDELARTE
jgi:hypothetical protein